MLIKAYESYCFWCLSAGMIRIISRLHLVGVVGSSANVEELEWQLRVIERTNSRRYRIIGCATGKGVAWRQVVVLLGRTIWFTSRKMSVRYTITSLGTWLVLLVLACQQDIPLPWILWAWRCSNVSATVKWASDLACTKKLLVGTTRFLPKTISSCQKVLCACRAMRE